MSRNRVRESLPFGKRSTTNFLMRRARRATASGSAIPTEIAVELLPDAIDADFEVAAERATEKEKK